MTHLASLRKIISDYKENRNPLDDKIYGLVSQFVAKFDPKEERDFTKEEVFELTKILKLNHGKKISEEEFEKRNFLKSLVSIMNESYLDIKHFFSDDFSSSAYTALENMKLLTLEMSAVLTKKIVLLKSAEKLIKGLGNLCVSHNISISKEKFLWIIDNPEFCELIMVPFLAIFTAKKALKENPEDPQKWKELKELAEDNAVLILNCTDPVLLKNIYQSLKGYLQQIQNMDYNYFQDVPEDITQYKMVSEDNLNQLYDLQVVLLEYYYSDHNAKDAFVTTVTSALGDAFPKEVSQIEVSRIICEYSFFQSSYIPLDNLVSQHFRNLAEDKNQAYEKQVKDFMGTVENFGSYAVVFAQKVLESLGVKNKIHSIILGEVKDTIDCFEQAARQWPKPLNQPRYIPMFVPTLPPLADDIPEEAKEGAAGHAVLLLFDQQLYEAEVTDSAGSREEGEQKVVTYLREAQQVDPATEDLDDEDVDDLKRVETVGKLAPHLKLFKIFTPNQFLPKLQEDEFKCILHCADTMVGSILRKENLRPHPKCDEATKNFINSSYMDIINGQGFKPRSAERLKHVAGILYLASERVNRNQLDEDKEQNSMVARVFT